MTTPYLHEDAAAEEGRSRTAYPDPLSPLGKACRAKGISPINYKVLPGYAALSGKPWTIGCGATGEGISPSTVWTEAQIDADLDARLEHIKGVLDMKLPWWRHLKDERQDVVTLLSYQLGIEGFLKFHHAISAMQSADYATAAAELLDSEWASQTPARAKRMARQMLTGVRAWE